MRTVIGFFVIFTCFLTSLASADALEKKPEQITSITYQDPGKAVLHVKNIDMTRKVLFCVGGIRSLWDKLYCSSISPQGEADLPVDVEQAGSQTVLLVPAALNINVHVHGTSSTYLENTELATDCKGGVYENLVSIFILRREEGNAFTPASGNEVEQYKRNRQRKLCRQQWTASEQ